MAESNASNPFKFLMIVVEQELERLGISQAVPEEDQCSPRGRKIIEVVQKSPGKKTHTKVKHNNIPIQSVHNEFKLDKRAKKILKAVQNIRLGVMNNSRAVKKYNIAKATISDHVTGKCKGFHKGRPRVFSKIEEEEIARQFKGKNLDSLRKKAYQYAVAKKKEQNFDVVQEMAGRKWAISFLKRYEIKLPAKK